MFTVERVNFRAIRAKFRAILCLVSTLNWTCLPHIISNLFFIFIASISQLLLLLQLQLEQLGLILQINIMIFALGEQVDIVTSVMQQHNIQSKGLLDLGKYDIQFLTKLKIWMIYIFNYGVENIIWRKLNPNSCKFFNLTIFQNFFLKFDTKGHQNSCRLKKIFSVSQKTYLLQIWGFQQVLLLLPWSDSTLNTFLEIGGIIPNINRQMKLPVNIGNWSKNSKQFQNM